MSIEGDIDFPLGDLCFASQKPVPPGDTVELYDPKGAPYGEREGLASHFMVRPMCFGHFPQHVEDWELNSIKVAGSECLRAYPVPLSLFVRAEGSPVDLRLPTQTPGGRISIAVTNVSGSEKSFECTMIGRFAATRGSLSVAGQAELDAQQGADAPSEKGDT